MVEPVDNGLGEVLGPVVAAAVDHFSTRLARVAPALDPGEREALADAARTAWDELARTRLGRVVLLELNAARLRGRLRGADARTRWDEFVALSRTGRFAREIEGAYPRLRPRVTRMLGNRVRAALEMARRLCADRDHLGGGPLTGAALGAGDSHDGGRTVARVVLGDRTLWYKPRSLQADVALAGLVALVCEDPGVPELHVPAVWDRGAYGWAEHVEHRFCRDDDELRRFYRGLGGWLAVMLATGGSDMHLENVVAHGPVPVVIDCETLFTPVVPPPPADLGGAVDRARALLARVLSTGLLPWRDAGGADVSAAGGLPGEQPALSVPQVVGALTDAARLSLVPQDVAPSTNLPEPSPRPGLFWEDLVEGFERTAARLTRLDESGALEPAFSRFAGARMRYVPLATQDYVELIRALWHPSAFRDDGGAEAAVAGLLRDHIRKHPIIAHEPGDLRDYLSELSTGDIPVHIFHPGRGRILGPGGYPVGEHGDQISEHLARWRDRAPELEALVVRCSLAAASLSPAAAPVTAAPAAARPVPPSSLERRRRALASRLVGDLCRTAVLAEDGTATWIGAIAGTDGSRLGVVTFDLYSGLSGIAVALASYRHAVDRGLADPVDGLDEVLGGVLRTLDLAGASRSRRGVGAFDGHGSELWAWLSLHSLTGEGGALRRARRAGDRVVAGIDPTAADDIVSGVAGVIVPLLDLAAATGAERYVDGAQKAAAHLARKVTTEGGRGWWPFPDHPEGTSGFAHGVTGIAWALTRLTLATGAQRWGELAESAFASQERFYDPDVRAWRADSAPGTPEHPTTWCNGSAGIGLAHADLHARVGWSGHAHITRLAAAHCLRSPSWGHSPCHGSPGDWELLAAADPAAADAALEALIGELEHGPPVVGSPTAVRSPGMMNGSAGVVHHLLRAHPRLRALPNPLLLHPGAPAPR